MLVVALLESAYFKLCLCVNVADRPFIVPHAAEAGVEFIKLFFDTKLFPSHKKNRKKKCLNHSAVLIYKSCLLECGHIRKF